MGAGYFSDSQATAEASLHRARPSKTTSFAWTVQQDGCAKSPLGPVAG